jgi:hypothetical protein
LQVVGEKSGLILAVVVDGNPGRAGLMPAGQLDPPGFRTVRWLPAIVGQPMR